MMPISSNQTTKMPDRSRPGRTTGAAMVADVVPLLQATAEQIGRDYYVSNR